MGNNRGNPYRRALDYVNGLLIKLDETLKPEFNEVDERRKMQAQLLSRAISSTRYDKQPEFGNRFGPDLEQDQAAQIAKLGKRIERMQLEARRKSTELDLLGRVWCEGGCRGGMGRFQDKPITVEHIIFLVRNARRAARWWANNQARRALPKKPAPSNWREFFQYEVDKLNALLNDQVEQENIELRARVDTLEAEIKRLTTPPGPEMVMGWKVERTSCYFSLTADEPRRSISLSKYGGNWTLYMPRAFGDGVEMMAGVTTGEVPVSLPDEDMMRAAITDAESWRANQ